jgi:hypothetical protein
MRDAALAASWTEQLFARVQAGQIPALAIGMVFLDGVAKGWLPAEPKSFRFVREDCSVQVVELRHRVGSLPLVPDHGRRTGTLLGKDARTIVPSTDSTTALRANHICRWGLAGTGAPMLRGLPHSLRAAQGDRPSTHERPVDGDQETGAPTTPTRNPPVRIPTDPGTSLWRAG